MITQPATALRKDSIATLASEDWQSQLQNLITDRQELLELLQLTQQQLPLHADRFRLRVPRRYAALMRKGDPHDPLLLQVWPDVREAESVPGYSADPLQEQQYNPLPGLLHKYPGRVLLSLASSCAINCRYCFRRHFPYQDNRIGEQQQAAILDYLQKHQIEEVIFSGGEPLLLDNAALLDWLIKLEQLPSIKRLRIHSRLPVVIPERIDEGLLALASRKLPLCLVIHCNHPNELDDGHRQHFARLRDTGATILNQSVLLAGVNDSAATLSALSEKLYTHHVLPYYLHSLDAVAGAHHFAVSEDRGREIYQELRKLPGYLLPRWVRETPGAIGKSLVEASLC